MKTKATCFFTSVIILLLTGCKAYISYHTKTTLSLEAFKNAVKLPSQDTLIIKQSELVYNAQSEYGERNISNKNPRKEAAEDKIRNQLIKFADVKDNIKILFEKYFKKNSCACGSVEMHVFVRKIIEPQTFYSHLSSPYRSDSYVFYIFTDYDPQTGLGRYYQTDAYYPRDAFSFSAEELCPDACVKKNRIEFFTGVFYLTHSDVLRQDVIALLGPLNDISDRKEFTIEIMPNNHLKFTKAFEFKFNNFYPIVQGNYFLEQRDALPCSGNTSFIFDVEYREFEHLTGTRAANAMVNMNRHNDTIKNLSDYRDYFYPLKGTNNIEADSGYVFFGVFDKRDKIRTETFYRYQSFRDIFNYNREIKNMSILEKAMRKKHIIKPFDTIKMRSEMMRNTDTLKSNFKDPSIIGEAKPGNSYQITGIEKIKNNNDSVIWLKIKKTDSLK